jgi:methylmalonyl-CoA/ethylmalonyl-CoA epimerase
MIKKVHHVAIAVKNIDEALKLYENLFGVKASKIEAVPEQGVKAALIAMGDGCHICLEVDDIDKALSTVAEKGCQLIDKKSRKGLAGQIGFLHPKSTKGVLIELAQTTGKLH